MTIDGLARGPGGEPKRRTLPCVLAVTRDDAPGSERSTQAKARTKRGPRRSSAYISIMNVRARRRTSQRHGRLREDEAKRFLPDWLRLDGQDNRVPDFGDPEAKEGTAVVLGGRETANSLREISGGPEDEAKATGHLVARGGVPK
jgi:hypothetical protein